MGRYYIEFIDFNIPFYSELPFYFSIVIKNLLKKVNLVSALKKIDLNIL